MAKVDLTRDYYADLELQPGASEGDIKKQFKKLALRYHPDRNPGREAEVNSKFVTIQLAHEVLTDPEQRAKYDAARARAPPIRAYGGFTTTPSSGTKGNPWASAGAQWAPPPKPPPPKDAERRKAPPTSAGAQRYSQFTAPNGAVPKTRQDPEASRTNYKAWESMKGPAARAYQPPPTPKPVPKEYAYQSGREESNSFKHPPPPRSSRPGHDEFRASTASESARTSPSREKSSNAPPKRNGYMPTTSSAGDEPPASSSSAYFTRRAGRASTSGPAAPPEPPPRNVPSADPFRQFREKTGAPLEPRLSTPYATHGGEKTNPFESINLSRSRSTREPSGRGGPANAGPAFRSASGERVRSASPPRARRHRAISPEPGITRADSDIHLGASPKRTFSHANRNAWPGGSSRGYARYTPPAGSGTSSNGDDSDSELNRQSFGTRSRTYAKRRAAQASARAKDAQGPPGGPEGINTPSGEQPPDAHPHNHEERGSDSSRKEEPSIFSFNVDDNTFQSPRPSDKAFTSNSAENISTKFTPEDWHGKFEAGDYFANDPRSSKGASRTRSGSRTGTRSPVKGRPASKSQTNVQPPIPNIDPEILSQAPPDPEPATASPSDTKFTAEEWARTFKPQNFAPPPFPSPNPSGRPPYPSRTPRRSKTGSSVKASNTAPAAGTADAVSKEDSSDDTPLYMGTRPAATPRTAQAGPAAGFESPNAMDIDPPSEPQSDPGNGRRESGYAAFQKAANDARNVPLEPSRAEWRAGDSSGTDAPPRAPPPPPPPREPGLPPRSPNPNQSRRRTTKSADEEDFKTNFEDLKNVAPLYHPATGLQSFADITSTLPFPSRAASTLTIPRDLKSGELDLPRPPRAPMVPPIPSGSARPSQSSWISYVVAFKAYMADWDIFNTKMVAHFVARRNQFGLLKPGWLEAFGDTDLKRYRDSLKEDVRIREYCTVAAEHHASAIDQFHNFKNAMR